MKKYVLFICLGVILVAAGLVVYFYKNAEQKENSPSSDQSSSSIKENDNVSSNEVSSDASRDSIYGDEYLVNTLYSYIPYNNNGKYETPDKNAYQDKLVTVNSLTNNVLMVNAMYHSLNGYMDGGAIILLDTIKKSVQNMYDFTINTISNSFNYSDLAVCNLKTADIENDALYDEFSYYLCTSNGGSGLPYSYSIRALDRYEINKDSVIIYDKEIFVRTNYEEAASNEEFYTSSTMNTKIANNTLYYPKDDYGMFIEEVFIDSNFNKMISYKHTFKKNINGDYYWYSTEPVK